MPEGIVGAQVGLGGEGELGKVGQRAQVVGRDAGGVERGPVVGDVVVDMAQRALQAGELQGRDLVARGDLDGLEVFAAWCQIQHRTSVSVERASCQTIIPRSRNLAQQLREPVGFWSPPRRGRVSSSGIRGERLRAIGSIVG